VLADATQREHMGKAFGLHRSLDTLGAAIGPLITALILSLTANDVRSVFLWTAIPGALALLVLVFFLRDRPKPEAGQPVLSPVPTEPFATFRIPRPALAALGVRFWFFVGISTIFAFGNSSDAFLLLRAADLNQSVMAVTLIYLGFNLIYTLFAAPLGALSDRWGRLPVLISGYIVFGLVYVGWAVAQEAWNSWVLFLVYGVYAAATEGVGKAFVTDLVPRESRGTALGLYLGVTGLAALPASFIGGWLWNIAGPSATFAFGAWAAAITVGLAVAWLPWLRRGYSRDASRTAEVPDTTAPV
jgi:MFS family permease